jgi:transcriptional regulator with XRE-family HTH domain
MIVRKLRLQRGWSQAQLAEFSGLSSRTIQRIERGENAGLESLKALAAVFEVELASLQREAEMQSGLTAEAVAGGISREERYALKQVQQLKGFYIHAICYVLGIVGMLAINLLTTPGKLWVVWPMLGWGIGLGSHAFRVYGSGNLLFGPEWEKREVEKRLGRKL